MDISIKCYYDGISGSMVGSTYTKKTYHVRTIVTIINTSNSNDLTGTLFMSFGGKMSGTINKTVTAKANSSTQVYNQVKTFTTSDQSTMTAIDNGSVALVSVYGVFEQAVERTVSYTYNNLSIGVVDVNMLTNAQGASLVTGYYLGEQLRINILTNNALGGKIDSSLKYDFVFSIGSVSKTLRTDSTRGYWNYTPPVETFASEFDSDSTTAYVRTTVTIKDEYGNIVRSVTSSDKMLLPTTVVPTISTPDISDLNEYYDTYGVFISNFSNIRAISTGTGVYGSLIRKFHYTYDGVSGTSTASSPTSPADYVMDPGAPLNAGSRTLTVTVTDTRNRQATTSASIQVAAYTAPTITVQTNRWDTIENEESDGSDTVRIDIGGSIPSINSHLVEGTLTVQGRQKNASQWTVISTISVSGTIEETVYAYNQVVDSNWEYQATLTDSFGTSVEAMDSVGTATPILEFHSSGKGLGIGTIAPEVGLDVGMQADFKGTAEDGYSRIQIVNPEGTETIALAKLTGSNLQLLAPSSPVNDYDRAFVNSHVFMQNNLALGWLTSGDAQTTVLKMNGSNQVELNWPSAGLRGRVGKLLWSGTLSEGGSLTDPELPYYQVFAFLFSASNGTYVVTSYKVDQTIYAGSVSYAGSVWMLLCGINITGTKLTLHYARVVPMNNTTIQTGKTPLLRVYGLL